MNAIRVTAGGKIDYTPSAAVSSGAIVDLGDILGVAERPIDASAVGALSVSGVFKLIKDGTSGPVFAVGDHVFWDTVNSLAVRTGGSGCLYFGTCVEAAGTNQAWVNAKLAPDNLPGHLADMLWEDVDLTAADLTLDIQDNGKVMNVIAGSDSYGIVFPACVAGLEYVVRCGVNGQRVFLDPDASGTEDLFAGPDIAGTLGKGRILTAATARKGDYAKIGYGAADSWMILAQRGIWTEEA